MTYVPFAPENGAFYTLTAGDGTIASFNNNADANFCGYLTDVTGLDSPDVRESADVLVQTDGGWHGNFWYGRRPITMTGTVMPVVDEDDRAVKIDRLMRVTNAMRQDAILAWENNATSSVPMQTWVRRQQPVRFTGAWVKSFQILLVSQFAPVFSVAQHVVTSAGNFTLENKGSYPSAPIFRIIGGSTAPQIVNNTTTQVLNFIPGFTIAAGSYVDIDMLNHTAVLNGTTNVAGSIDYTTTNWPVLITGNNAMSLIGGGSVRTTYRDTWV